MLRHIRFLICVTKTELMKRIFFAVMVMIWVGASPTPTWGQTPVKNDVMAAKRYVDIVPVLVSGHEATRLYYMGCIKDSASRLIVLRWELRDAVGATTLLSGTVDMDVSGAPGSMHKMNVTESVYLFEHMVRMDGALNGVVINK